MDGVGLGDGGAQQLRDEVGGDGADLRKLQSGVAERTVVDGDLDALRRLGLLSERARPSYPCHHPGQLVVKLQPLEVSSDRAGMAGGPAPEYFFPRPPAAPLPGPPK